MKLGRDIGKISALRRQLRRLRRQPQPHPLQHRDELMVEEGALPEQVDKVMVDFGYPIGPVRGQRPVGPRHRLRHAASAAPRPIPNYRKLPIADRLVEMGRLGQKTGAGWYRYEKGDRTPHPDPEVARASSRKSRPSWASSSAASPTRRSCAGCCSPRSTRPARSSRRARPTAPATST